MNEKQKKDPQNSEEQKIEEGHSEIAVADISNAESSLQLDYGLTSEASVDASEGVLRRGVGAVSTDEIGSPIEEQMTPEKEAALFKEAAQRIAAEFDNYRKRIAQDFERVRDSAKEELITRLLVVLDHLELAIKAAEKSQNSKAILEGVKLVLKQLFDILESEGLKKIDASGKFNPCYHECVECEQTHECEPDTILDVIQEGYEYKGKVIRAAKVKVAAKPKKSSDNEKDESEGKLVM